MTESVEKIKQKLIGTWKLESIIVRHKDNILYPFGKDVSGVLFYSENYMSVQIMMPLQITDESKQNINMNELAQTLKSAGYMGYFGPYEIDDANETIIHHVDGSISQQVVGCDQIRKYQFEGDKLVLSTGPMFLKWEKIK